MTAVPKLFELCLAAIADELHRGGDDNAMLSVIYELPSELFDSLLRHLRPLALQKLQENLPFNFTDNFERAYDNHTECRKRRRIGVLDTAWKTLYKVRWPGQRQGQSWLNKHVEPKYDSIDDWQQKYWERHLQDCVDAVAATAMLPSYDGSIGEIQIPDAILEHIGCKDHPIKPAGNYTKFSYHCQKFGLYARLLKLPSALCVAETCDLFQSSKLRSLELQWIKSSDHVDGLCRLLKKNSETLRSIEFIHCKFSPTFMDEIFDSLLLEGLQGYIVEHFSIKRSSFFRCDSSLIPAGLISFLTSGRSLHSLILCDDQLGRNLARVTFKSLLDASARITMLDLSENNISGFLSQFRWRPSSSTLEAGKSLQSLKLLNLRFCDLVKDDVDCLKQALIHMPNLESLDLSGNPIEDGLRSLIAYFTDICNRERPFIDLKLEHCELTCNQVIELLRVLSAMKKPLNMFSIKGNRLGSKIGAPLGKFLCSGVHALDVEDIGLGSCGFLEALEEVSKESKIAYINISNNQGGAEAAMFISKLISHAQYMVAIDARYNKISMESLPVIFSCLKASKGELKHLDLGGNTFCDKIRDEASFLSENGIPKGQFNLSLWAALNVPYDNDP